MKTKLSELTTYELERVRDDIDKAIRYALNKKSLIEDVIEMSNWRIKVEDRIRERIHIENIDYDS